jgi:hypothetical protein
MKISIVRCRFQIFFKGPLIIITKFAHRGKVIFVTISVHISRHYLLFFFFSLTFLVYAVYLPLQKIYVLLVLKCTFG